MVEIGASLFVLNDIQDTGELKMAFWACKVSGSFNKWPQGLKKVLSGQSVRITFQSYLPDV